MKIKTFYSIILICLPICFQLMSVEAQNPYIVEIITLYNESALIEFGSHEETKKKIRKYIADTNTAFENSGVNAKLKSVGIKYAEVNDVLEVAKKRNELCADIGALIANDEITFFDEKVSKCGKADRYEEHDNALVIWVNSDCGTSLTFAHEIGHVFDANHDENNSSDCEPHCGLQNCDEGWRTVMAYKCEDSDIKQIPYFSNPEIDYRGSPTGTEEANNVERMNEVAQAVSCYNGGSEANCGIIGRALSSHRWAKGWTTFKLYKVRGKLYTLQLKKKGLGGSGYNVRIREMNNDGTFKRIVTSYIWSEGWTNIQFYKAGGDLYMFQLMENGTDEDGNNAYIRAVNDDGTIGRKIKSYKWSEGWTSIEFYNIHGKNYMLQAKKRGAGDSGYNVHIRKVSSNGKIGSKVESYNWSAGWTTFKFYKIFGKLYLFQLKENGIDEDGYNAHIREVGWNGKLGRKTDSFNWTEGWTSILFFKDGLEHFMLQVKEDGKGRSCFNAHVRKVKTNGKLGRITNSYNWSAGWTTFEYFEYFGQQYILQASDNEYGVSGNNVHIRKL